jgi:hypothetical protein
VTFNTKLIADRIEEVAIRENQLSQSVARDVAFHMTDWLEDLARYNEFCANPNKMTNKEVEDLLLAFLTHVPNHIAAASKLYAEIPVTDVFGVGATSDDDDQ